MKYFIIVFVVLCSIVGYAQAQENFVKNPSFEEITKDGKLEMWTSVYEGYKVTKEKSLSGTSSMKLSGTTATYFGATQLIRGFKPGSKIQITSNVYVEEFKSGMLKPIHLSVRLLSGKTKHPHINVLPGKVELGKWVKYTYVLDLAKYSDTTSFTLWILARCSKKGPFIGTVYYDNIEVKVIEEGKTSVSSSVASSGLAEVNNLLPNASFEHISGKTGLPSGWLQTEFGEVDDTTATEGKYSVKITVPQDALGIHLFHYRNPKISIPAGTRIKLSGWSKVDNYIKGKRQKGKHPKHAISMSIKFAAGSNRYPQIGFSPSEEWEYKEKFYTFDKEVTGINYIYLCHYYSSGTVWYDDIYFGPVEEAENTKNPLVRIPKTNLAPVLDGNLDDDCWQKAAVLTGFTILGQKIFPSNKTLTYLTHDDKNLYLAACCYEKILDPAQQQLYKFKAAIKERDALVFIDDCVEVFISSSEREGYFQLAFNSLATQYDGFKFDKTWNARWKVATSVGENSWKAEVAIPFSEIGIKPEEGSKFRLNVCREEKPFKEMSCWAPVEAGFHEPDSFGTGVLCSKSIQAIPQVFPKTTIGMGKQSIAFKINNLHSSLNLKLNADIYKKEKRILFSQSYNIPAQIISYPIELPILIKEPGTYQISFSLLDKEKRVLLYRSPEYTISSNMLLEASSQISFPGEVEFWINENRVSGKELYLKKGINILCYRCKKKDLSDNGIKGLIKIHASSSSPGEDIKLDNCWKVSTKTEPGWQKNDFDDRKWDYAVLQKDGSIWGSDSEVQEIVLRRIILVNESKFWPIKNIKDGIYIARGTAQHLPLIITNPMKYSMKDLSFSLQMPTDIKLIPGSRKAESEKITKNRKAYNLHTFHLKDRPSFTGTGRNVRPSLCPVLSLSDKVSSDNSNIYFRFQGQKDNRNITEVWNKIPVYYLSPLLDKRPKKLDISLWHSFGFGGNKTEIRELFKTWHQAGFNTYIERVRHYGKDNDWFDVLSESRLFKIVSEYQLRGGTLVPLARKYPEMRSISFGGKKCNYIYISPAFLIEEGREEFKALVTKYVKETGVDALTWDFEFGPFGLDVSPPTLKRFVKFAHLSSVPTEKEIKEKYKDKWIDFQTWILAEVVKVMQEGVKAANPEAQMYIYSAYQSKKNKSGYSIDWNYMRNAVDVAMAGYGRQSMKETLKALSGVPFCGGVLFWSASPSGGWRSIKTRILRRITDGAKGITFYNFTMLDGRANKKISEACAILADFEEFFLKGKKINTFQVKGGINKGDVVLLAKGKERLLLVFNEGSKSKTGTILNQGLAEDIVAVEYDSDKLYRSSKNLKITVPPNDVKVYLFTPGKR